MRLCVLVAGIKSKPEVRKGLHNLSHQDVVARVDRCFDSSTILRLSILSFMTGCDG